MNTNEIAPKFRNQLNRIRIVSQIVRYALFVFLAFLIWTSFHVLFSLPGLKGVSWPMIPIEACYFIVLGAWYWKLTQLFRLYERGQIFAAETIRCIKKLGLICLTGAAFKSVLHFFPKPTFFPPHTSLPSGVTITGTETHTFQVGFFSFDFGTGVDFGLIFSGIIIVLIAWIMDEGRKIQEEQELTV